MFILYKCKICGHLLFEGDEYSKEIVQIKLSGIAVRTINLREICASTNEKIKPVKTWKRILFCVVNSEENIIKIMCPVCKNFFLINLDTGTWTRVGRDWPAA